MGLDEERLVAGGGGGGGWGGLRGVGVGGGWGGGGRGLSVVCWPVGIHNDRERVKRLVIFVARWGG